MAALLISTSIDQMPSMQLDDGLNIRFCTYVTHGNGDVDTYGADLFGYLFAVFSISRAVENNVKSSFRKFLRAGAPILRPEPLIKAARFLPP